MATKRALSIEDGDLERSLVGTRNRPYSDIDLAFLNKPSGDVYKKVDADAVKQAVKTVLMTNRFDKPFLPSFGADLQSLLFDLSDPFIEDDIKFKILNNIAAFEPRAIVKNVQIRSYPDNNEIAVTILFNIVNTNEEVTLTTTVSRLR